MGPFPISAAQFFHPIAQRLAGEAPLAGSQIDTAHFVVRLPRIAAALLVGRALAGAGAVYQGLFRNPLVSPDILGVSAGAGLGAALGIFLALPVFAILGLAFAPGLGTVALVYLVATAVRGREPNLVLVLAGVVLGALAGVCISLRKILADPYDQLPAIPFWLLGSQASVRVSDVAGAATAVILGLVPLVLLRWRMNLMALGARRSPHSVYTPAPARALRGRGRADDRRGRRDRRRGRLGRPLVTPHIAPLTVGPNFPRLLPTAMRMAPGTGCWSILLHGP